MINEQINNKTLLLAYVNKRLSYFLCIGDKDQSLETFTREGYYSIYSVIDKMNVCNVRCAETPLSVIISCQYISTGYSFADLASPIVSL